MKLINNSNNYYLLYLDVSGRIRQLQWAETALMTYFSDYSLRS